MDIKYLIKKNTYFDSVTLMLINNEIKKLDGIEEAVVGMGTDYNLESIKRLSLYVPEMEDVSPNDLIICIKADTGERAQNGIAKAELLLVKKTQTVFRDYIPRTQEGAAQILPSANMVLISIPGQYAFKEAKAALDSGRNVMLFSDNVTIEEELELKNIAIEKGLLMMGPDCGTAIINGVPLAFANKVRRGNIGVVAASGTGLQEVTSIIHLLGCGISQAIGTGGRDLSEIIEGRMALQAIKALENDPQTKVLVLLSKPPADSTLNKIVPVLKSLTKPLILYFIGADAKMLQANQLISAESLEDTAIKACALSEGREFEPLVEDDTINKIAEQVKLEAPYLRGLYSGGTFCDEAQRVLLPVLQEIYSNTPVRGALELGDVYKSNGHAILDLGDDAFTRGKAHPMIDPALRKERIIEESKDKDTGMIIFDIVLGFGAHPDMASEIAEAVNESRKIATQDIIYGACICGTDDDIQDYAKQKKILEDCGVEVFPSNVSLTNFVKEVFSRERQ